ncbi:MAG: C69 family dipeptidase [Clostridia bacterium]
MKKMWAWLLVLMLASASTGALASADRRDPDWADKLPLNCMTIIAGKGVSATGHVLIGHNEDDDGRCVVRHGYVEGAQWPEGTVLPAEEGRAAVPQVASTWGYYWSEIKAAGGGLRTADMFLNENGVYLISNTNADSRENIYDDARLTEGGIEYNLRRAVIERATSARDGLKILIDLIETWGYAPSGRAYTVADKDEAFMIQIASGRHYVAARVPDDMVVVMPNHYTFRGLDEFDEMFYPDDIVSYAIEQGWYTPAVAGDFGDFDFSKAYQDGDSYRLDSNVLREKHALEMLLGRAWDTESEGMPFAVSVDAPVTPEAIARILSTHYEGTPDDETRFGPGAAPHDTRVRRICTGTTLESSICAFTDEAQLITLWTAYGRPCELPYLPIHPLNGVADEIDRMDDPAQAMAEHLLPDAEAVCYKENGWQKMRDFENLLDLCYAQQIEGVKALNEELHAGYVQSNEALTAQASALIQAGKADEATALVAQSDRAMAKAALERLMGYAREHFPVVEIAPPAPLSISAPESAYTLTFTCPGTPLEKGLIFGMGFTNTRLKYAPALEGTLTDLGSGTYSVAFDPLKLMADALTGEFEFFLGGQTEEGNPFTAMTLLKISA